MERITEKMLQYKVDYLNKVTGNPTETWTRNGSGLKSNIGNYHISGAYGGITLHQIMNDGGGVHSTFGLGYVPKRELYNRLCAFIDGISVGRKDTHG
jgi:hypothetical protein